jgi:hypothetical protein
MLSANQLFNIDQAIMCRVVEIRIGWAMAKVQHYCIYMALSLRNVSDGKADLSWTRE